MMSDIVKGKGYTLYKGDCLEIMQTLETDYIAMVTDPPYGINANAQQMGKAGYKYKRTKKEWDNLVDISFYVLFDFVLIWGGNYYSDILPPTNQWLIWDKKNYNRSFSEVEMAWTNFSPNTRIIHHHWAKEKSFHTTQKPVKVMKWCMSFIPNHYVIFDPFMGSGSTGVAAVKLGRKFIGIEQDADYFAIAAERIANAAGEYVTTEKERQSGQIALWDLT